MSVASSRRFFRFLGRFNAVVFAIAAMMVLVYGALAGYFIVRDFMRTRHVTSITAATTHRDTSQLGQASRAEFKTQHFTKIPGHDVMWAALSSREELTDHFYSKEATNARDYLFYDMAQGRFHRLLNRDDVIVSSLTFVEARSSTDSTPEKIGGRGKPAALLATLIDTDTNGDGRISTEDMESIALAGPTGLGITMLRKDVDTVLGYSIGTDGMLILMIRDKGGATHALKVDLIDFKLHRDDSFSVTRQAAPG